MATKAEDGQPDPATPPKRLVDRVDLFSFRSRQRFAELVATELGRDPAAVLGQLALLLDKVERARAAAEPEFDRRPASPVPKLCPAPPGWMSRSGRKLLRAA